MSSPEICVLKTDGINCDYELAYAFESNGGRPEITHVNELGSGGSKKLESYSGLAIPGGFSYGDDVASGKILANELVTRLGEQLQEFADAKKPILGICNGFQVLVKSGLLPSRELGAQQTTLTHNDSGRFICEWVDLEPEKNVCVFAPQHDFENVIPMEIAHGEGKFVASEPILFDLASGDQIVFRYSSNPNGSVGNIAGICDPDGLILGMMPHPERSVAAMRPDRSRTQAARDASTVLFKNFVTVAKGC